MCFLSIFAMLAGEKISCFFSVYTFDFYLQICFLELVILKMTKKSFSKFYVAFLEGFFKNKWTLLMQISEVKKEVI